MTYASKGGHERIRIAEHVKRLGPHEVAPGIVGSRRFSYVPATDTLVLRFRSRVSGKGLDPDASMSIKCGFDPIVRLRSESNCGEYIVQRFCAELATDVSKVTQLS
jgi:hypothetical protein